MGNHQHVVCFCNGADFLGGGDAADGAHVGTDVLGGPALHQHFKFLQVGESLAGGNGNPGFLGHFRHGVDVVRGDGVFQHHGAVGFHLPGEADGLGYSHAPVDFQHEVKVIAHRLPADAHLLNLVVNPSGEEFVPAVVGGFHRPVDEDLGGGEAFFFQFPVAPGQGIRISLLGHNRGVHPDLVPGSAAQKLVHRHPQGLALDVPQGDVNGGDGAHDHGAPEVDGAVEILVQVLNSEGVLADEVGGKLADAGGGGVQVAPVARLAQTHDARIGVDMDKQVVLGVNQLYVGDFQNGSLLRYGFVTIHYNGIGRICNGAPGLFPSPRCGWW